MCTNVFETLIYIYAGVAIVFLPLTIITALGWGAVTVGDMAKKSAQESWRTNKADITKKLIEHGLNKHLANLQMVLDKNPQNSQVRFQRAMAFFVKDDIVNAISDLQICFASGNINVELCFFLGLFYAKMDEVEEADKMFTTAEHLLRHPEEISLTRISDDGQQFEFRLWELYNCRALNLYQMAFRSNVPQRERTKQLNLALDGIVRELFERRKELRVGERNEEKG
eukprot:TRINITY_DN4957_c0_g1_i10.p1 TRINITY_DN4957_c0_g1~~TRINITY_DN4957_c0_g1_i10.p1  ORF type:complete len:226 (-),score=36.77 TRINITY_DN4957_c0_g1_i10:1370-2047(-)